MSTRPVDRSRWLLATTLGVIFVLSGLPKLVAFRWEVANFTRFGLPAPEAWVVAAGIIEIGGGALLIARRWVAAACLALAATMGVAIVVSGIWHGDVIPSLTVAPVLLIGCVAVLIGSARSRRLEPEQTAENRTETRSG